jgi:hypothetical protein
MILFIESLPEEEQNNFGKQRLPRLIEMYQKAFNCLSLSFMTAGLVEPDLISNKGEETREVLAWLDDQLFDFRCLHEELNMINSKTQKDEK